MTVRASAFGYESADLPVTITVGDTTNLDVALAPVSGGTVSGTVREVGGGPIADATVELVGTPLTVTADGAGGYRFGPVAPGAFRSSSMRRRNTIRRRSWTTATF